MSISEERKQKIKKATISFLWDLGTGGTAAAIAKTINSPLEVSKLIQQTQPGRYNGMLDLFRKLPAEEGFFKGFWAGNGTNVLRYFPTQALNFAFKGFYKDLLMPGSKATYGDWNFFGRSLLAGGMAGASSMVFVYPLDLARTRLSTDEKKAEEGKVAQRKYKGLKDCLKITHNEGGIRGLYRGFNISVAGIIPYRAVYFGGYDTLKRIFMPNEREASFWYKWLLSQTNTIVAQFITYPIDTVRRTLMKAGELDHAGIPSKTFKSSWECFVWLKKERGWKGIYKGALLNTYRATGAALCMVFYDTINVKFAEGKLGEASGA